MLSLGAASLGDSATARSIGAALVERYGEAVTDQARLQVGGSAADITAATALMALLAASNGDPLASRFWAYVEANPGTEAPSALYAVGFVTQMLAHGSLKRSSFEYEVGGERKVVELEPGGTFQMSVTARQLNTLSDRTDEWRVGVTTSWREAVTASSFEPDPDISIRRQVTPSGLVGKAELVTVRANGRSWPDGSLWLPSGDRPRPVRTGAGREARRMGRSRERGRRACRRDVSVRTSRPARLLLLGDGAQRTRRPLAVRRAGGDTRDLYLGTGGRRIREPVRTGQRSRRTRKW